jgi:hypothetical protein
MTSRRRPLGRLPIGTYALAAAVVGVVVAVAARAVAGGSCPPHDPVALVTSCEGLVASLAVRIGGAAAAAMMLMQLLTAGLARTVEDLDRHRRAAEEEASVG